MPCLLIILAVFVPRFAIALIFFFTKWLETAFTSMLWPLLGFFFLPYTTLAYMATVLDTGGPVTPGWLVVLIIAILADFGHWGGGYRARRRRVVVVEE